MSLGFQGVTWDWELTPYKDRLIAEFQIWAPSSVTRAQACQARYF